jgi:hypothetical protein
MWHHNICKKNPVNFPLAHVALVLPYMQVHHQGHMWQKKNIGDFSQKLERQMSAPE